jgi:hypothetical protein
MLATARELTRTAITFQSKTWRNERTRALRSNSVGDRLHVTGRTRKTTMKQTIAGTIRH